MDYEARGRVHDDLRSFGAADLKLRPPRGADKPGAQMCAMSQSRTQSRTMGAVDEHSWDAVAHRLDGELLEPGAPGYDEHRTAEVPRFAGVRPAAIARCRGSADVAEVLRSATGTGVGLAVRGGGHCFAGRSSTRGLRLDTRPMDGIAVRDGLVRIGAGARLARVYAALAERGLALPLGCGETVGIAGLTIGGGLGVLGRRYGLTADRLVAAEVVTADGRVLRCEEDRHADLLWCLRGAGSPAVVTELTFRPVPEPTVRAFVLSWPFTLAGAAISGWQRWAPDAPEGVYGELHVDASGGVRLGGVLDGGPGVLDALVERIGAPLRAEVSPELPLLAAKGRLVDAGPAGAPEHAAVTSGFVDRNWPDAAVERVVDALARQPGGRLDLLPMGGAYNRPDPAATGFAHRRDRFLARYEAAVPATAGPWPRRAARAWLDRLVADLRPYGTGRGYRNFPDVEDGVDHDGENRERLAAVRDRYDPAHLLG